VYAAATSDVNADLLRWFEHQLELRGVEVRLGERLDADTVVAAAPDAVIVATGARWGRPAVPGIDLPHVRAVDDFAEWLLDGRPVGPDVVVLGGDLPGLGVAEEAGRRGARVTVLEASDVFGLHLGLPGRWRRVHDLRAAGITLAGGVEVLEVTPEVVRWRDLDGDHETVAGAVLVTSEAAPDTTLADEVAGRGLDVVAVGDAGVGAGLLEHAMRGALEVAVAL
jgi:2,4-dienoyl-CoA reductase (NADPH2)